MNHFKLLRISQRKKPLSDKLDKGMGFGMKASLTLWVSRERSYQSAEQMPRDLGRPYAQRFQGRQPGPAVHIVYREWIGCHGLHHSLPVWPTGQHINSPGRQENAVSASPTPPNAAESVFLTRHLGALGAIKLWEEVLAQTHVHVKNLGLALHKAGEILLNNAF